MEEQKKQRTPLVQALINFVKGFFIGSSMSAPGVSGGTMAIILGIYDELISSVSSFFKHMKKSLWVLVPTALGGIIGIVLIAKPLELLITNFKFPMHYLFMGAIAGSIPMMYGKAKDKKVSLSTFVYLAIGLVIVLGIWLGMGLLPENFFTLDGNNTLLTYAGLLLAGFVIAVALILPGISGSSMLVVLGLYEPIIAAINAFDVLFLIPLAAGVLLGVALTTRFLENAMAKHSKGTYLIILGFMIGAVIQTFPGIPTGWNWLICPVLFLVGFFVIKFLCKFED
ncbi:MAG: DUF368 domain-containing protein [Oscillospiraceae bacterium]